MSNHTEGFLSPKKLNYNLKGTLFNTALNGKREKNFPFLRFLMPKNLQREWTFSVLDVLL